VHPAARFAAVAAVAAVAAAIAPTLAIATTVATPSIFNPCGRPRWVQMHRRQNLPLAEA